MSVVRFPPRAHQDLMNALFLSCREVVKLGRVSPEDAADMIEIASRHDCVAARQLIEAAIKVVQGKE